MENFMKGLGNFVGFVIGIFFGALVTILVSEIRTLINKRQRLKNLKFELDFNIQKMDEFLKELSEFREASDKNRLDEYDGYFTLSRVIYPTAQAMYYDGSLYKYCGHDDIIDLLRFFDVYTQRTQGFFNQRIRESIKRYKEKPKKDTFQWLDEWDDTFTNDRKALRRIVKKLNARTANKLIKLVNYGKATFTKSSNLLQDIIKKVNRARSK